MIDITVSNLRRADGGFNLEFAAHAVDENVEVKFTHAGDDRLAGFFIRLDAERRIFSSQAVEREAHLFLVALGLRLDGDLDDRLGEFHALEDNLVQRIAERVAGGGFLEACESHDVAGKGFFDVFTRVGMHLQHAADAFALFLDRVHDRRALGELAGIDAGEGERTDEGVVHDLERKHRKRLFIGRMTLDFSFGLDVDALDRRNVERRRQVIADGVEQRLNALVLEGRNRRTSGGTSRRWCRGERVHGSAHCRA